MTETIQIVPMDESNIKEAVLVHIEAFPDSLICRLGFEAVERQYRWLLFGPHHETHGLLGLVDGWPAAVYLGGDFIEATTGYLRSNWSFLCAQMLTRPGLLMDPAYAEKRRSAVNLLLRKVVGRATKPSAPRAFDLTSGPNDLGEKRDEPERSFGHLILGVRPSCQRRGLARKLMEAADLHVESIGYRNANLRVVPGNTAIIGLHESRGYQRRIAVDGTWQGQMYR